MMDKAGLVSFNKIMQTKMSILYVCPLLKSWATNVQYLPNHKEMAKES